MKIILFKLAQYITEENRFGKRSWFELPSHILSTATCLRQKGYDVTVRNIFPDEIIDFNGYDVAVEWVSIADGLYEGIFWLTRFKEAGCSTVLMLFDNWKGVQQQILADYADIDYAVNGQDRELVLASLLDRLSSQASANDLPGVVCRRGGVVVDNGLAPQTHDLFHLTSYRSFIEDLGPHRYSSFFMRAAFGCPFPCTFCHVGGRKIRFRPVEALVDEMEALPQGAHLRVGATDMLLDSVWTADFCETLLRRGIDLSWETDVRVDSLKDKELLQLMRRAGCRELALGIESLDPDILKAVHKGITKETINAGIQTALNAGLIPSINMMLGHPLESEETITATMEGLKSLLLRGAKMVGFQYLRPLPGTVVERECIEAGLLERSLPYRYWVVCRNEPVVATRYLEKERLKERFGQICSEISLLQVSQTQGLISVPEKASEPSTGSVRAGRLLRQRARVRTVLDKIGRRLVTSPPEPVVMAAGTSLIPPLLRQREVFSVSPHNLNIYRYVLRGLLEKGVRFITSKEFFPGDYDPVALSILIRHDIDFLPETTKEMIAIEDELGVRSEIQVILDDNYYEIEPHVDYFKELHNRKFLLGLHTVAPGNDDFFSVFRDELKRFQKLFGFSPEYFTIHGKSPRPDSWPEKRQAFLDGIAPYLDSFGILGSHNYHSPDVWIEDSGINQSEFSLLRREFLDIPAYYAAGVVGLLLHPIHWVHHPVSWPTEARRSAAHLAAIRSGDA